LICTDLRRALCTAHFFVDELKFFCYNLYCRNETISERKNEMTTESIKEAVKDYLKDYVRVTYELEYPWKELHLNVSGKCASVLYRRDWWERRKKETGDPTGRKVMEQGFRVSVACPYTIKRLEIDEHPEI